MNIFDKYYKSLEKDKLKKEEQRVAKKKRMYEQRKKRLRELSKLKRGSDR